MALWDLGAEGVIGGNGKIGGNGEIGEDREIEEDGEMERLMAMERVGKRKGLPESVCVWCVVIETVSSFAVRSGRVFRAGVTGGPVRSVLIKSAVRSGLF